jgi:hypothetical protein
MEGMMLRLLVICATLMIAALPPANAQQREAILQRIEIPGASFDIVIAMPKPAGVIYDLAEAPDALLVNLAGDELALGFERVDEMLKMAEFVRAPACSFRGKGRSPVAIYAVPKTE